MTKQETIELLQKQLPSFYSVDQVIELIKGIEDENNTYTISSNKFELLSDTIKERVSRAVRDLPKEEVVDIYSAEFEVNRGNEICLVDFLLNAPTIIDAVTEATEEALSTFFLLKN